MWRDIPNIQNYQVNENGEVRTLNYGHKGITKILKQFKNQKGYLRVNINNRLMRTHRLVAMAFLPDYDDKLEVNHKNGIKSDNRLENIEMVTPKQNSWHRHYVLNKCVKPVIKIDKNTKQEIEKYLSVSEAERKNNVNHTCIINVCKNKQKTAGGYIWRYL